MSNVLAFDPPPDAEKDAPLREDIRVLGRLLGDTVREQEGAEVFDLVERIRQASIRFHRDNESARAANSPRRSIVSTATRRSRSCGRSAISRISPTSPRISTTSAATARMSIARSAAASRLAAHACNRARAAGFDGAALTRFLRRRAGQPGVDGASDRGPAQEHDQPRTGDRRAARRARAHRRRRRRDAAQRGDSCGARSCCCGAPTCCARPG